MIKCLTPTIQAKMRKKLYGIDCETYGQKNKFYCASIYGDDYQKTFFDKNELIRELKFSNTFRNSMIVASNLQFDFFCIFDGRFDEEEFKVIFRGSDLIMSSWRLPNKKCLKFIGTENYMKASVETLGKIIKVPKLEKPKFLGKKPSDGIELRELVAYNMRDAEISQKFTKFFLESCHKLGCSPKLTIASCAMSLFRNKYLKREYYVDKPEFLHKIFKAYYGGRTEVFRRGLISDCYYYDVNSLYPSVMRNAFPDPNSRRYAVKGSLAIIEGYHGVSDVVMRCPNMHIPFLPVKTPEKLIFPAGAISGWYSNIEIRKALELGYTPSEVKECIYYKYDCYPLKEYVEDLYTKRMQYKAEKSPMELNVKILLNSLYGKFAQKFTDRESFILTSAITMSDVAKYDRIEDLGKFSRCIKHEDVPTNYCIPIWAVYVTAYARIKMFDYLKDSNPYYMDTDSVITQKKLPISDKLGELKLEHEIKTGVIVRPKMYQFIDKKDENVSRLKGVPRKLVANLEDLALKDIEIVKFMKFKESLRRKMSVNEMLNLRKRIALEDTKRVWEKPFSFKELQESKPIMLT